MKQIKQVQQTNRMFNFCFKWWATFFLVIQGSIALAAPTSSDFASVPPLISENSAPNVMLVMSNDHELYKKAYTDYNDLDGDGLLDDSYNDDFVYTGYFDSNFCYSYETSGTDRFIPVTDISGNTSHRCDSVTGDWSGNFLNWSAMTRIDIVRTVLYGGKRISDTATSGGTAGETILERSFIPDDAHAYSKVFVGITQWYTPWSKSAISMCNVTYPNSGSAPLIRVAYGEWPHWAASEQEQCHYTNESDRGLGIQPGTGSSNRPGTYQYAIRVTVCEAGLDALSERCKAYTDSGSGELTYKPVGLLQQYGDNTTINFGLMTGSYNEHIKGGVLRKDILPLVGNSTASQNEINLDTGQFINQGASAGGIVNTLNRLQIVTWNYSSNVYGDCNTWGITKTEFLAGAYYQRQCSNWGNPLSEIYLEALRYFTGDNIIGGTADATAAFEANDSGYVSSLQQLSWNDPINSDNYCASCSIIVLSTGLNSFDKDNLGTVTDIWDVTSASRLTTGKLDDLVDDVANIEGILGGSYLVGNNGADTDEICTAKTITKLSDVEGLCPEVPNLEGGFDIAGLAYHAQATDLRSDYDGVQSVNTFSVALAESLPSFELDVNGNPVSFVPTCQSNTDSNQKLDEGGWSNCSFLNVKVESQGLYGGSMLIAWEDSLWGSDFDMDAVSRIEYCIGDDASRCPGTPPYSSLQSAYNWTTDFAWKDGEGDDAVQFRVSSALTAAGFALRFGYTISGVENDSPSDITELVTNPDSNVLNAATWKDGSKFLTGGVLGNGNQSFLLARGNYGIRRLTGNSGNSIIYHEPAVYTATSTVTAGKMLNNPLWYAAKYGSFNDIDNDGTPLYNNDPDDHREWDTKDTEGNDGEDGIPDNYFPVRNPTELITSLSQIFESISERISSGTAAAVVANSSTGLGAVYQAYYHPNYSDSNDNAIVWGGVLHSMFIDESGRFREDNGNSATLDNTGVDYVVDIYFDESVTPNRTRFQRYLQVGTGPLATFSKVGLPQDLEHFGSIWNARDELADISQANIVTQRSLSGVTGAFSQDAGDYRYIFTYLDNHLGGGTVGEVDAGEVVDFVDSNFNPATLTNHRFLGLPDSSKAMDLVKYIRGQDITGWRSRLVDIPGDGTATPKYWVLGDIVHSSPLVVNPPDQSYDINFGDEGYDTFKEQYARRRQMIYAGGNDGMLHAFNGGVWDSATNSFNTQTYNSSTGLYDVGQSHQLGAEMWAYVPMNLLPHLQWLKEAEYPHVYYMDAAPESYDVNIFNDDATHPGGWGTILVVGMRLGGGDFNVDLDGDTVDETLMSSAFIVMDITDPEKPPTLLAEISDADLGYTTSTPTLIKARIPTDAGSFATPVANRWMLMFGSGPDTLNTATSTGQDAKVYAYDLVDKELVTIATQAQTPTANPSGFFGDFLSVDWDNDFVDDVVYVGTVEGSESAPSGRMKRITLSQSTDMGLSTGLAAMSDVLNVGQPITAKPNTQIDVGQSEKWVLFGTGRLFTSVDNRSETQQSFYGIKEATDYDTSSVTVAGLLDSTNIIVQTNEAVSDTVVGDQLTVDTIDLDTFGDLYGFMNTKDGWVRYLSYGGGDPSERVFNTSLAIGSSIVFTTYKPSYDLCTIEGDGYLYALNFRTGTAEIFGPFGSDGGIAFAGISLGQGAPSAPTAIVRTGDDASPNGESSGANVSIVTGSTTGVIKNTGAVPKPSSDARLSWEELSIPF